MYFLLQNWFYQEFKCRINYTYLINDINTTFYFVTF